jgi:NADPH:quinone reductase-like Zn-dependent oxidoreductase
MALGTAAAGTVAAAGSGVAELREGDEVMTHPLPLRRHGGWVVVNGAGGVTGGLLVQLAAARGARVIATASAKKAERIRDYGASEEGLTLPCSSQSRRYLSKSGSSPAAARQARMSVS